MFAEVLSIITQVLMNNHLYTFGGELRVQEGNGSIGDRATGIIAQLVMVNWDRRFKMKLKDLQIVYDIIKRYIDDINGLEYKDGELKINPEKVASDKEIDDDLRTMKIIQEIANDIDDMITMTVDVRSEHPDKKLPVLDLKVWMTEKK